MVMLDGVQIQWGQEGEWGGERGVEVFAQPSFSEHLIGGFLESPRHTGHVPVILLTSW